MLIHLNPSLTTDEIPQQDRHDEESAAPPPHPQKDRFFPIKECAISVTLAVGLITAVPALGGQSSVNASTPALSNLVVLISGPPIKDPGAFLRYGLPIKNKAIREVQKPLEDIIKSLKVAGVKALDSVER